MDFSSNSNITFGSGNRLDIGSGSNFAFGLGYKHNDKYSLELRYLTKRGLLNNYISWGSEYETLSLILGYSFF